MAVLFPVYIFPNFIPYSNVHLKDSIIQAYRQVTHVEGVARTAMKAISPSPHPFLLPNAWNIDEIAGTPAAFRS